MNWLLGITVGFVAFLLVEAEVLRRARQSIPIRIVVTGTRGKSSLVRILAAGIRAADPVTRGASTWAKITGDEPLLLLPDHPAHPLRRRGPARLHEQVRLLVKCHRHGVRCLVLESMTISPEAMRAEMRLVQPTLVVITNVRDDHRETLGSDPDRQREAYLAALPAGCRWLSLDTDLLACAAGNRSCPVPLPEPATGPRPAGGEGNGIERELLTTAEAVLDELGLNNRAARLAMREAAADLVHPPRNVSFLGQEVRLLDAFSANDLQSVGRLWEGWRRELDDESPWSVLLSTRADRPLRTRLFCNWLADRSGVDSVHVTGSHRKAAARLLRQRGIRVLELKDDTSVDGAVAGAIASAGTKRPKVLVGLGNARGLGLRLRSMGIGAAS